MDNKDEFIPLRLVSVLLPTRDRVEKLNESLSSLENTACDHTEIEVLIRVDDDDNNTLEFLKNDKRKFHTRIVIGPRGRGYADLHLMYNELCSVSKGRFLFLWNDDATMLTQDWDEQLRAIDDDKVCYVKSGVSDSRGRDQWLFPIVHRSYYEALGHFSMSAHNDTYVYSVFENYPQAFKSTTITVYHHALQTDDKTAIEGKGMWPITKSEWYQPFVQDNLKTDIQKLEKLLKQQS